LYLGLGNREVTARQAAPTVGISPDATRRNLDRLAAHGLATKTEGRPARYQIVDVDVEQLNVIAKEYGTDDWVDRKTDQYDRAHKAQTSGS